MHVETIAECIYEMKAGGAHAHDAIDILKFELQQNEEASTKYCLELLATIDTIDVDFERKDTKDRVELLLRYLIGITEFKEQWVKLITERLLGSR